MPAFRGFASANNIQNVTKQTNDITKKNPQKATKVLKKQIVRKRKKNDNDGIFNQIRREISELDINFDFDTIQSFARCAVVGFTAFQVVKNFKNSFRGNGSFSSKIVSSIYKADTDNLINFAVLVAGLLGSDLIKEFFEET